MCPGRRVTPHLTVSYASQTPAGIVPAATRAAGDDAANPLGFLAALVDHLTGGKQPRPDDAQAVAVRPAPAAGTAATDPLADLAAQLDALEADVARGEAPTPAQRDRLGAAIDTLAAATQRPASDQIAALRDRLAALADSAPELSQALGSMAARLAAIATPPADADTETVADIIRVLLGGRTEASARDDAIVQMLAGLGIAVPVIQTHSPVSTSPAPASTAPGSTSLLQLSAQLSQIGAALAVSAPDLVERLETIATRLVSTDTDPALLGRLTSAAADSDATALKTLVQTLASAQPASVATVATPQIAATAQLELPAPIAPAKPPAEAAASEHARPAAPPREAKRDSAPRLTVASTSAEAKAEPEPRPDPAALPARTDQAAPPPPTTAPGATAAPARPLPTAYQPMPNPINMGQLAFEMVRQVHQGTSRFTIRLDPPELGRVDVRLNVDASGAVTARLTVDRTETLDLFQRDQRTLERALAQAGLDASRTSLEFSLRQNPFANMSGGDQHSAHPGHTPTSRISRDDGREASPLPAVTLHRGTASAGGVNIFA